MSIFSRSTLLSYFLTGEAPTQGQFAALINSVTLEADACLCIKEVKIDIPTAQVLTLNSVPVQLVAAPGAGYAIEVLSASVKVDFNTTAYATNVLLNIKNSGATYPTNKLNCLDSTVSMIKQISFTSTSSTTNTQTIENAALNLEVETGDPTAGDSDITIYVTYRIITL